MSRFELADGGSGGWDQDYPGGSAPEGHGGTSIAHAVRRRWWLLPIAALLTFGAAWFFLPESATVYRAMAVVRMDDARRALTGALDPGVSENIRSPEFMVSQVHVVRSRSVVGQVVDWEGLQLQPSFELPSRLLRSVNVEPGAPPGTLSLQFRPDGFTVISATDSLAAAYGQPVDLGGVRFTIDTVPPHPLASMRVLSREAAIERVLLGLAAVPRDRAAILDIIYQGTDPYRAQRVVNAVALAFQGHNTRGAQEAALRRREFIEGQWIQAESALAAAQQRLSAFRSSGRLYSPQERLRVEQAGIMDLDAERNRLSTERGLYTGFLARIEDIPEDQLDGQLRTLVAAPGVSPIITQLFNQFAQYQRERESLIAAGRALTHPEVERLTTLMTSARDGVVEGARIQISSLDLRIGALREQRERTASAIEDLPDSEAEQMKLQQEVDVAASTTEALRMEYQRARIAEAVNVGQAEILDFSAGAIPYEGGNRIQKLVIAAVLGLMLGGAAAFLLEASNKSVRWRGELEGLITVPGLGVIPNIDLGRDVSRAQRLLSRNSSRRNGKEAGGSGVGPADFHTLAAEAYRVLRTNLIFHERNEQLYSLVVTSASAGEGKTTTAANLAASFARQELRVLLIDCDLRRPRLHKMFEVEGSPGIVDLLVGSAHREDAIRSTHVPGLSLLPRGNFDERAAEMLGGPRLRKLLADFRNVYDLIIFDTPPVLAAADAAALAAMTDGALFVVRAGRTPRAAARDAVQQLQGVGANIVGFVLNDPDAVASQYGEYAYASEYYAVDA